MIKTLRLENGITLVLEPLDFVRSVSIGIWIRNGSVDETPENNGISHFIEHMMFKGSINRDAKKIADEMAAVGGHINAFTAKEYTCYYAHTLDEHLETAIDILGDMLTHPAFKSSEIKKEKGVILEEIAMSDDSPEDIVHDHLENQVFEGCPLSMDILGTRENVRNFDAKALKAYHQKHYVADNMVIAVAGSFNEEALIMWIEKYFCDISLLKPESRQVTPTRHAKTLLKQKEIEQVHMVINYPAVSYLSDETFTLSVLNTLIGGGINSRLFMGIREDKGLTYSIYTYVESYATTGMFNIYAAFNPNQLEEVLVNTFKELRDFISDGLVDDELNKVKQQLKSNLIIGYENMNSRMSHYGKSKLMTDKVKTQEEIIEGIDQVTASDVLEMARTMFNDPSVSISLVGNTTSINQERVIAICKESMLK